MATRLGDFAEIVMGQSPPGESVSSENVGLPLLNGPSEFGSHHPFPVQYTADIRKRAQPGDLLFCVRGSTTGRMNWADREYAIGRGLAALRHKQDVACQHFVRAVVESRLSELLASATGSTFPNVSRDQLFNLPAPDIAITDQRTIAHILGTLDDKIELNRQMAATLEEMARAIFKSWFIDFDPVRAKAEGRPTNLPPEIAALFPDSFDDSKLGPCPSSWTVSSIESVSQKIGMGPFGSNIKVSTFVDSGVPIISGRHLNKTLLEHQEFNFITASHAEKLSNSIVTYDDIVFTHAGNIGQVSLIPRCSEYDAYVLSQRQFFMRCNQDVTSCLFMVFYFTSPAGQHALLANASQVGVPSIARPVSYLKSIQFILPPKTLLNVFDSIVGPLTNRVAVLTKESQLLKETRDTLLPRLLRGELIPN